MPSVLRQAPIWPGGPTEKEFLLGKLRTLQQEELLRQSERTKRCIGEHEDGTRDQAQKRQCKPGMMLSEEDKENQKPDGQ